LVHTSSIRAIQHEEKPIKSKEVDDVNRHNERKPLFEQLRKNQEEDDLSNDLVDLIVIVAVVVFLCRIEHRYFENSITRSRNIILSMLFVLSLSSQVIVVTIPNI
jgi:hypothetical protein